MKSILFFLIILMSVPLYSQTEDIFLFIEQATNKKIKVKDAYEKGLKWIEKNKDESGRFKKQLDRWFSDAQYRIDEAGNYITPAQDMATLSATLSTSQWAELGPKYWNKTSGWNPGVGRLTTIAVDPLDSNRIFVGSPGGGLWKSTDAGRTWQPKTDNNAAWLYIYCITISKWNRNIIYAGLYNSGGIIRSVDGGETWGLWYQTNSPVRKFIEHPTNSNILFYTTSSGVSKSSDGGISFTLKVSGSIEDLEIDPSESNIVYYAGYGNTTTFRQAVGKSTDFGETFREIPINTYGRTLIEIAPSNPNIVYIAQARGSEFGYLYKSTDKLQTFKTMIVGSVATGTNYYGYSTNGTQTGGQATYDMTLGINPTNENEVFTGGIQLWKSLDGGVTFTCKTSWALPTNLGYNHADQHVFHYINGVIYTGSDGGIYKSFDGGNTYVDYSNGLGIRQFYRIYGYKNVFSGGAQDNGSSLFNGTQWKDWLGADGMDGVAFNDNIFIGTTQYGSMYKTLTQGDARISVPTIGGEVANWITPLTQQNNILYTGHGTGWYSTDTGKSFKRMGDTGVWKGGFPYNIDVNGNYIYGTSNNVLVRFINNGNFSFSVDTIKYPYSVLWVASYPNDPNHLIMITTNTVYRIIESFDRGRTYTAITGNFPSINARCVRIDSNGIVYIGSNVRVFKRTATTTWQDVGGNMPMVAVNDLDIINGKLYAATYGRGVWVTSLSNDTVITVNQPPIANAGSNLTFYVPRNSTVASATITGTGSDDNSGLQLQWKDLTTNTTYPSIIGTIYNILVSKLKGNYTFELTATDIGLLVDKDTMELTVLDTNTYIKQPLTTVKLYGNKVGKAGVSLTWETIVQNDIFNESNLYISINGGVWQHILKTTALIGSYSNNNLASGTAYAFMVISTSQKSNSVSNLISIKTGGKSQRIPIIRTPDLIGNKTAQ